MKSYKSRKIITDVNFSKESKWIWFFTLTCDGQGEPTRITCQPGDQSNLVITNLQAGKGISSINPRMEALSLGPATCSPFLPNKETLF